MVFARNLNLPAVVAGALLMLMCKAPAAEQPPAAKAKTVQKQPQEQEGQARPSCMHCGSTCGLEPVCVCTPGTRKIQTTEYETRCDPVCVPCCSGPPWKCHRGIASCTACEAECPDAWVRQRKKLVAEKKDEEKPAIERKVVWVCRACGPHGPVSCTGDDAAPRRASWWPSWLPYHP